MKTHAIHKTLLICLAAQALLAATVSATVTKLAHYGLGESGTVTGATSPFSPLLDDIGGHHFAGQQAVGSTASLGSSGVAATGSTAYLAKSSWASGWHSTNFTLTNDWSVQLWMRPDSNGGTVQFETDNSATGVSFVFSSDNKIYLAHGIGGTQNAITGPNSSYTAGTWYRLGIVNYNGTNHFYINGTEVITDTLGGTVGGMLLGFAQGGSNGGPGAYDELNVWSFDHSTDSLSSITDALNAGIVDALYWDGAPGTANSASDGDSGTWSASVANWDRGTGNGYQGWTGTVIPAVFAGTAGTVTMDGDMSAASVAFNVAGYVIDTGTHSPTWTVLGGAGGFTKTGAGTLTLTSASTASGALTVSDGTLVLGDSGALGSTSVVLDGGGISRNVAATTIANAISIGAGGGTITGRTGWDNWVSLSGPITGSGALTIKGMVAFRNASNSYSGTLTIVNAGSLNFATAGSSALALLGDANQVSSKLVIHLADSGSAVYIGSAQTIDQLTGTGVVWGPGPLTVGGNQGSSSFGGTIIDTNSLIKTGTGTFTLTGTNTYTGATTINNGVFELNGSLGNTSVSVEGTGTLQGIGTVAGAVAVKNGGTLAPGGAAIGTLTVSNTLTLAGDTRLQIHSGSMTNDKLSGMSGVTYGGTLTVTDLGNALAAGQKFILFTKASGTYTGSFATLSLPTPPAGLEWNTSGLTSDGSIQLLFSNQVAAPSFLPAAGGYCAPVSVTISSDTGSEIYYTTNGDTPTFASDHGPSPVSGISIPLDALMTIKAFAFKTGMADSEVASADYTTLSTAVWTNSSGGSWTNASNWLSQVIGTGVGSTVDFSTLDLTANATITLDSALTVGKLVFGDTTPDFNWTLTTGGPLTLDHGITTPVIEVKNQATSLAVAIAGTNGFTKTGAGTLTLTSASTASGALTVSDGTLVLGDSGALGSTSVVLDGGGISRNVAATIIANAISIGADGGTITGRTGWDNWVSLTGPITGTGALTIKGMVAFRNVSNSYSGTLSIVNAGSLTFATPGCSSLALLGGANQVSSNLVIYLADSGSAVHIDAAQTIDQLTGTGVVWGPGTLTVGGNQGTSSFGGTIINTISLAKTGAGTFTLTGTNTYTGATAVNGGALIVNGGLGNTAVTVASAATLGGTGTLGGNVTYSSGALALFTQGSPLVISGALTLNDNVVHLVLPADLAVGTYPLATYNSTGSTGTFAATPVIDSGSLVVDAVATITTADGTVSLIVSVYYDAWKMGAFANGTLSDKTLGGDPDGDQHTNLEEYAFDTDPTVSSSSSIAYTSEGGISAAGQPVVSKVLGDYYAVFGRRVDYVEAGLTYTVEFSAGLDIWVANDDLGNPPTSMCSGNGTIDAMGVKFPESINIEGNYPKPTFFRMKVESH